MNRAVISSLYINKKLPGDSKSEQNSLNGFKRTYRPALYLPRFPPNLAQTWLSISGMHLL